MLEDICNSCLNCGIVHPIDYKCLIVDGVFIFIIIILILFLIYTIIDVIKNKLKRDDLK